MALPAMKARVTPRWRPLLTGALADHAAETVRAIVSELHEPFVHTQQLTAGRLADQALLHGYLARAWPGSDDAVHARRFLEESLEVAAGTWMPPALHGGFTYLAWVMQHLGGQVLPEAIDLSEEDPLEDVEAALGEALATEQWTQSYDLIGGLVGLGIFALERLPRPGARRCLERAVHHLLALSEVTAAGLRTWRTPETAVTQASKKARAGRYNLGTAHGVPGVVGLLAAAWAHGIDRTRVEPALEESVRWLLAQRRPAGTLSTFAYFADDEMRHAKLARGAWCYGDPGVAVALLAAAQAVGHAGWEKAAVEIGLRAVRRPEQTRGVKDGGLCHGEAGLAHLFLRMYQQTGEEAFGREAHECFTRLLARRKPGEGMGGYAVWSSRELYPDHVEDNASFLSGSVGIALALLGALSEVEPAWDRLLLASIRPPLPTVTGHGG